MAHHELSKLIETKNFLTEFFGASSHANIGLVLGSGLSYFANQLKNKPGTKCIAFKNIPHVSSSTVNGHQGELISGVVNEQPILVMNGRLHFYEGYDPSTVTFLIRVLGMLGIKNLILSNASGAIGANFEPGHLMVIADHLNLTATSPLLGPNISELGPRFVDMTTAYDTDLLEHAQACAREAKITMHKGIYAGLSGPCYETPAEVRMLKTMGADAVGMSTVFETIVARHMGIKVVGICCLTNKAAGLSSQKISHEEVVEKNAQVADKFSQVIEKLIGKIAS